MRCIRIRFTTPEGLTSATARHHIVPTLQRAGYSGDVETVMTLVDELIRNARRGAVPSRAVVLEVSQDSVRVALEDVDVSRQFSTPQGTETLEQLADQWGCDVGVTGTSVWFTLGRPGR